MIEAFKLIIRVVKTNSHRRLKKRQRSDAGQIDVARVTVDVTNKLKETEATNLNDDDDDVGVGSTFDPGINDMNIA